jgi:hypothetical protein
MLADGVDANQPAAMILRHASVQQPRHNARVHRTLNAVDRAVGQKE